MIRLARHLSPLVLLLIFKFLFAGEAIAQTLNAENCARREAIAARIYRVELDKPDIARLAAIDALTELVQKVSELEQAIADLPPVPFGSCPEHLENAALDSRLRAVKSAISEATAEERARRERLAAEDRARNERFAAEERARSERVAAERRRAEERRTQELAAKPWDED